jgi:lysozyme
MIDYARGIDVNHYHRPESWEQVWASGISFVGLKASQGRDYIDPSFIDARAAVLAPSSGARASLLYHFADATADVGRQINHYLDVVGELGPWEIPVLDLERGGIGATLPFLADGAPASTMFDRADEWTQAIEETTGVVPIVYTRRVWLENGNPNPTWADRLGLWVARYRPLALGPGELPAPWAPDRWRFWQWTDGTTPPHVTPGAGAVDANVFNGTVDELRTYVEGSRG